MNPLQAALAVNIMAMLGLPASEAFHIDQADGSFRPGRIVAYNDGLFDQGIAIATNDQFGQTLATNSSQFTGNNPHEFLSNYAVRYTDPHQEALRAIRELLAPEVRSNNSAYVDYAIYSLADAYLAMDNALDVRRGVGADYPTLRNPAKTMTSQKLPDIGLAMEVDEDEELLDSDWQQRKVALLLGILDRTELRTAIALFVAAATNTAKTWDITAGKDPDQDMMTVIDGSTVRPNNGLIGPGAWTKRALAHRAQDTAGGYASATLTESQLADLMGLSSLQVPRNRYATGAATLGDVLGSYTLFFSATPGMSRDDFSNMKTLTAPARNGARRAVFVRQVGDKRWRIVVTTGKRLVAVTSAIGANIITVS